MKTIFLSYEDPETAVGKMEDNLRIAKEWAEDRESDIHQKKGQDIPTVKFD